MNDFAWSNNSRNVSKKSAGVLYYDCTNYFLEIEQEGGLKQYGVSKEYQQNPIVQMRLFMKGEGYIPTYTRADFTDDLHEAFGFRTDYQIVSESQMKKIIKLTKP